MKARPPALMLQGTASGVGKSVLTAGLVRLFARRGLVVRPFKAQNIALNAHVCRDGGEIGRAQAVQAAAAGIEPSTAMNPLLLKATGDECQVVLRGRALSKADAERFWADRDIGWRAITDAYAEVADGADLVVLEGAGSPAEPNLMARDWTNMRMAAHAGAAVLLVGDIERGGVFAHLRGTLDWLPAEDRARVVGLVINRLRGDAAGLAPAVAALEQACGVPVAGIVPFLDGHRLPDEDGLALAERSRIDDERPAEDSAGLGACDVLSVVRLPHLSNHDEFDGLGRGGRASSAERPGARVRFVETPAELAGLSEDWSMEEDADPARAGRARHWLVLPGTKATRADLEWLRAAGWPAALDAHLAAGGHVLGVCGGYQLLGGEVRDSAGVEGRPGSARGLGLLPVDTRFHEAKRTWRAVVDGEELYQIHHGRVQVREGAAGSPAVKFADPEGGPPVADGWRVGRVWGTTLHGAVGRVLAAAARGAGEAPAPSRPAGSAAAGEQPSGGSWSSTLEAALDGWADHVDAAFDITALLRTLG